MVSLVWFNDDFDSDMFDTELLSMQPGLNSSIQVKITWPGDNLLKAAMRLFFELHWIHYQPCNIQIEIYDTVLKRQAFETSHFILSFFSHFALLHYANY